MTNKFHEMAFTKSVKAAQEHYGSRRHYAKFEGEPAGAARLSEVEAEFIEQMDGFYMATVSETGQPYIQFRGGEPGFLRVIDDRTLGFADFRGNLQYISIGNLSANDRAALFLMDYANRRRLKIMARVEVKEAAEVPDLIESLRVDGYDAKIERALILHVEAFDWNCPQHITPKFTAVQVHNVVGSLKSRIEALENEVQQLRAERK